MKSIAESLVKGETVTKEDFDAVEESDHRQRLTDHFATRPHNHGRLSTETSDR